jgi:hypothetical protein
MAGNGLQSSIWAPGNSTSSTSRYVPQPGDWMCLSCSFPNFASRYSCLRCSLPKSGTSHGTNGGYPTPVSQGNAPFLECRQPRSPPPPYTAIANNTKENTAEDRVHSGKYGLATSRWAPRNAHRNGQVSGSGKPQIWTRVCLSSSRPNIFFVISC